MKLWNFRGEQNNIADALQLSMPDSAVISVTGAGGKTSLICAWARELAAAGRRTVITTTTHMAHPDHFREPYEGIPVLYADDVSADFLKNVDSLLEEHNLAMIVSSDPERSVKVMAPPDRVMDHLYKTADAVLIEADGSRRMPLKWPAPWEPVIPVNTDITVCVAGLSALGQSAEDVMYRWDHLPERFQRDTVDEALVCAVLASPDGGLKGVQGEFRVFLNQADTEEIQKTASHLQQMLAVSGIRSAWGPLIY